MQFYAQVWAIVSRDIVVNPFDLVKRRSFSRT